MKRASSLLALVLGFSLLAPPTALAAKAVRKPPHASVRRKAPHAVHRTARRVKVAAKKAPVYVAPPVQPSDEGSVAFDIVRVRRRDARTGEILSSTTRFEPVAR